MAGLMGGSLGDKHEPIALVIGVLGTIIGVLFFMQKFNMLTLSFEVTDITYLYFFAGFSTLASLILLFMTLGFLHVSR